MSANTEINREVGWSIALSVLMIVAGVLAIIVPPASGIAVTILVGWLLLFCGGAYLAYAWQTRCGGGLWWGMLLGIIYLVAGGYILLHPMAGLASLTLVLVAYLLLESILEFILACQLCPLTESGWLVLDGMVALVLAIMIGWTWPSSTRWVIGTLAGIGMLFGGFTRLMLSLTAHRMAHAFQAVPERGCGPTLKIN